MDKEGTSAKLKPKNSEEIAKLGKVMDKNDIRLSSVWKELGAGIKAKFSA